MGIFDIFYNKKNNENKLNFNKEKNVNSDIIVKKKLFSKKNIRINCDDCDGFYKIREGKYGVFAGCSNYPNCKSTKKVFNIVLKYIEQYGINIYCWKRECYKCKNSTSVYSYYLNYDLEEIDKNFFGFEPVGLGNLKYIDEILSQEFLTIKMSYSNITRSKYMANTCEHCGALQGRNYIVEDPHEIMNDLENRGMDKFLLKNIKINDITVLINDIKNIYF